MNLEADHRLKVPVVRRFDYTLYLEQANKDLTFIHCRIRTRWTPRVKRELGKDFEVLKSLHGGPLYAQHIPGDEKHLKFLRMFGFSYAAQYTSAADGRTYHIYKTQ